MIMEWDPGPHGVGSHPIIIIIISSKSLKSLLLLLRRAKWYNVHRYASANSQKPTHPPEAPMRVWLPSSSTLPADTTEGPSNWFPRQPPLGEDR